MKNITILLTVLFFLPGVLFSQKTQPITVKDNAMIIPVQTSGSTSLTASHGDLKQIDRIMISDNGYTLASWDLVYAKGNDLVTINVTGNKLSPEVKKAINEIKPGIKLYFENIMCNDKSGAEKRVGSFGVEIIK